MVSVQEKCYSTFDLYWRYLHIANVDLGKDKILSSAFSDFMVTLKKKAQQCLHDATYLFNYFISFLHPSQEMVLSIHHGTSKQIKI